MTEARLHVRRAGPGDAAVLSAVASAAFPLACPPSTAASSVIDFIARHLTPASFGDYLADARRVLFLGEVDGQPAGYTMLVEGEPDDADVAAALTVRPTIELSKCYVLGEYHRSGLAAALMEASLQEARRRGAAAVWLGVNQENARANRFYDKNGFAIVGTKKFLVGARYEDDYVREHVFRD